HSLCGAGIAYWATPADEQHGACIDLQRRIVDAAVIIFRSVEYDGAALEGVRILWIRQIARAKVLRDHAELHDRGVEQVTPENPKSGALLQRLVIGADH